METDNKVGALSLIKRGSELYVVVPEKLGEKTHLFDQPPFTWARENPDIIPEDFFTDENGWYVFCKTIFNSKEPWSKYSTDARIKYKKTLRRYRHVDETKYDFLAAVEVGTRLRESLEQNYPFIIDYVKDYQSIFIFSLNPRKRGKWSVLTYAAYAVEKAELEKLSDAHKWTNLAEELPASFFTPNEVKSAIPPKNSRNREYRLLKALGMLKK